MLDYLKSPPLAAPRTFTMDRLIYPPNSHEMNEAGKEQVRALAQILLTHPTVRLEIRGHDDGTEREAYAGPNPFKGYTLSQLRADCVLRRLTFLNVPSARLQLKGVGAAEPVADDATADGRQRNRRVEIVVLP